MLSSRISRTPWRLARWLEGMGKELIDRRSVITTGLYKTTQDGMWDRLIESHTTTSRIPLHANC